MTKELIVVRARYIGEEQQQTYEFEDEAVLATLEGGNVEILDEEDGTAIAYFGGVAEARWAL